MFQESLESGDVVSRIVAYIQAQSDDSTEF